MNQVLIDHHAVMSLRPNYKALLLTLVNPKYRNVGKALKAMGITAGDTTIDKQTGKKAKYHMQDLPYIEERRAAGATWQEIADHFDTDPGTIHKAYTRLKLKELRMAN